MSNVSPIAADDAIGETFDIHIDPEFAALLDAASARRCAEEARSTAEEKGDEEEKTAGSVIGEVVTGIRTVASFNAELKFFTDFARKTDSLRDEAIRRCFRSALSAWKHPAAHGEIRSLCCPHSLSSVLTLTLARSLSLSRVRWVGKSRALRVLRHHERRLGSLNRSDASIARLEKSW